MKFDQTAQLCESIFTLRVIGEDTSVEIFDMRIISGHTHRRWNCDSSSLPARSSQSSNSGQRRITSCRICWTLQNLRWRFRTLTGLPIEDSSCRTRCHSLLADPWSANVLLLPSAASEVPVPKRLLCKSTILSVAPAAMYRTLYVLQAADETGFDHNTIKDFTIVFVGRFKSKKGQYYTKSTMVINVYGWALWGVHLHIHKLYSLYERRNCSWIVYSTVPKLSVT
jgi:hypothetical protein